MSKVPMLPLPIFDLAFICRMCLKMAKLYAEDETVEVCSCLRCVGPLRGGAFPEYEGPLKTGDMKQRFCYLCGEHSTHTLDVDGTRLGVCDNCRQGLVNELSNRHLGD